MSSYLTDSELNENKFDYVLDAEIREGKFDEKNLFRIKNIAYFNTACRYGQLETLKVLLSQKYYWLRLDGSNYSITPEPNSDPLEYKDFKPLYEVALKEKQTEIYKYLLEKVPMDVSCFSKN